MAKLEYAKNALDDIEHLVECLIDSDLDAALNTFNLIDDGIRLLKRHPEIGRLVGGGKRELVISRGSTGYIAIYAFDKLVNVVVMLAIKPQRESEFH